MRYLVLPLALLFMCAPLGGCSALTTSTAYVPNAAPASAPCAPAPAAVQYVPVRVVPQGSAAPRGSGSAGAPPPRSSQ